MSPRKWTLLLLLCLPLLLQARSDIFANRKWEPEFKVLRSTRFLESADAGAAPVEEQVFTCMLAVQDLQFRRGEPGSGLYQAGYEVTLEILTGKGRGLRSVASRYDRREIELGSIPRNEDSERHMHRFQLEVPPGEYTWWVEFQDLSSRRRFRREGVFTVLDLQGLDYALSELWLVSEVDSLDPKALETQPFYSSRGGAHPEALAVYYEIWHRGDGTLSLSSRIEDRRGHEMHQRQQDRFYPQGISRNLLEVPLDRLGSGEYEVMLELLPAGVKRSRERSNFFRFGRKKTRQANRAEARFDVRWRNGLRTPVDLDRNVEQLRYILPGRRYRDLSESGMDRKLQLFKEFWESVDPTPDTEENELQLEYYRRAEFADTRFSWSRFPGWRSDRGRIYMIHGDPDEVERFEGNMDQPAWERWYYEQNGREFLFVDRAGFGDYQLLIDPRY